MITNKLAIRPRTVVERHSETSTFDSGIYMLALGILLLAGGIDAAAADSTGLGGPPADTIPRISTLMITRDTSSALTRGRRGIGTPPDTLQRRRAVEVSEWYSRRLTIHRYVAYATVPVFALQYAAGAQLYEKGNSAPGWAKTTHRVGASALAGMFTVNTVTGVWNLWESRSVSQGRVLRTLHALSMLSADAAFTYAGIKLSDEAENSNAKRRQHRTVALASMGVTIASGLAMKLWNR